MKIVTPHYYKDFKCIAGACTDTCCAGWDVDVDDKSYRYYKTVDGNFGKRLKSVMVPEKKEDAHLHFKTEDVRFLTIIICVICILHWEKTSCVIRVRNFRDLLMNTEV